MGVVKKGRGEGLEANANGRQIKNKRIKENVIVLKNVYGLLININLQITLYINH